MIDFERTFFEIRATRNYLCSIKNALRNMCILKIIIICRNNLFHNQQINGSLAHTIIDILKMISCIGGFATVPLRS